MTVLISQANKKGAKNAGIHAKVRFNNAVKGRSEQLAAYRFWNTYVVPDRKRCAPFIPALGQKQSWNYKD